MPNCQGGPPKRGASPFFLPGVYEERKMTVDVKPRNLKSGMLFIDPQRRSKESGHLYCRLEAYCKDTTPNATMRICDDQGVPVPGDDCIFRTNIEDLLYVDEEES
jgi:hypothetical protein